MPAPWSNPALDHVVLRVRDLDRMLAFYTEVLGCEVAHRNDPLHLVHLKAGDALIDLVWIGGRLGRGGAPPDQARPNLDHLCLRVTPWDEAAVGAHLASHGIAVDPARARYGAGGQAPSVYFTDPEGNGVELRAA
jgi:catechol 2,3-dioxygenase-like lactoylglutathione lyase family enzyme